MLRAHKGEIPFLYWLLPFITGIALGMYPDGFSWYRYLAGIFFLSISVFISLNIFYNPFKLYRYSWLGGALLNVILLSAGWLCAYLHHDLGNDDHFSKTKANYLIGQVVSEPKQKGIYTRFTVQVKSTVFHAKTKPASGKILVTLVADSNSHLINYGYEVLIPATYKPVDPPFNPAEFNYKHYLAHQNIYHQSFISRQQIRVLQYHTGNPVIAFSLALRQRLVSSIKQYIHDPQAAAIASTLLLGYKANLSADILQAYSKTGTIHVLSVSGAHVGIIFLVISFLLKPFRHYQYGKLFNAVLTLILIWGYAILTGLSPAVCRAAVMLSMFIIGKASGRPVHNLNVLAVSAFALLLYDPYLITDVGFQLSYLAVFGIITLQPIIVEQLAFKNKWVSKLWQLCALSLAAQLITFPLSAYYFHQFPVYFLLSNLLIILPAEVIVIAGMLFLISSFFSVLQPVTKLLAAVLEYTILLMNKVLAYIEHLPYSSFGKIWLTGWEHLIVYMILICTIYFMVNKKLGQLRTALLGLLVLCCGLSWKSIDKQTSGHVIFFNVKKNSAIVFQKGNEAVVVTDLLPDDKNYQYSIRPCLDSLGVDSTIICKSQQSIQTSYLNKQHHLIQFSDKTFLLFNPLLQNTVLPKKINVDYVFFTHNPHSNLRFIRNNYNFKHLIADANNSYQRINKLKHEADSMHLKINVLAGNKSFIIASNK